MRQFPVPIESERGSGQTAPRLWLVGDHALAERAEIAFLVWSRAGGVLPSTLKVPLKRACLLQCLLSASTFRVAGGDVWRGPWRSAGGGCVSVPALWREAPPAERASVLPHNEAWSDRLPRNGRTALKQGAFQWAKTLLLWNKVGQLLEISIHWQRPQTGALRRE
jgi:hypothetical protein